MNVNENKQEALDESKKFLDIYYSTDYPAEVIDGWTTTGSPEECAAKLRRYRDIGFDEVTVRITGWDQFGQLRRVIDEVLPLI